MQAQDCQEEEDEYVFAVTDDVQGGGKITLTVGYSIVGAIEEATYCMSRKGAKKLYVYGAATRLEVIGTFIADLTVGSKCVSAEFTVIKGRKEPLLGRESAIALGVLKLQGPLNLVADYSEITRRYKDIFTGIGKFKDFQLKLHIDQQIQ
ncbi:uncharacterized protein [Montipora foliosa]|uniref:uncharacterized protein n=1 Tax=Montipora foliosa TaxID=591990 RepID=UPI0035F1E804